MSNTGLKFQGGGNGPWGRRSLAFGLVLLAIVITIWPRSVEAALCPQSPSSPSVTVNIEEAEPRFETDRSSEYLQNLPIDTRSPYPSYYHADVGGATDAVIHLDHEIKYKTAVNDDLNVGCLWFQEISVTLRLYPKIYIADQYSEQSCWFREIFSHEVMHIEAERQLMKDHAELIRQGLRLAFKQKPDYVSGLIEKSDMETRFSKMKWSVRQALGVMFEVMMQDRLKRHQEIDSLHNYRQVGRHCPEPYNPE